MQLASAGVTAVRGRLDFRVLGPLEVHERGAQLALGAAKQRALLAILLLHAGEPVSTDRLVDLLWGEHPPPSALNSVHVYVSALRKALGDGRLQTRHGGYALELDDDELDLRRFEGLVREGRTLLAQDDPGAARERLSEALGLWRGAAFPELAHTLEGRVEVERLEELRLGAIEERLDAELELGQAAALVPDLEALVSKHPYRERLRAQLMLALYRSGRQADALGAYREGRRRLSEELGLEPSAELQELQRAILNHDPVLAGAGPRASLRRRRIGPALVASSGALLLVVAAAAAIRLHGGRDAGLESVAADSVGVIDAGSHRIVSETAVAGGPARLADAGGGVWVGSDESQTVSQLDPKTLGVRRLVSVGAFPSDVAVGEQAVWIYDGRSGRVVKVDPSYGVDTATRASAPNIAYDSSRADFDPTSIAAGLGSVWLTDGSSRLVRIDPTTVKVVERIALHHPLNGVAVGTGSVWAISGAGAIVFRIDRRGRVTARVPIVSEPGFESPYPLAIDVGEGAVWVLNSNTATVTRIDPAQRTVSATIPIGIERVPVRLAVGAGSAWVASSDGTLARIDVATNAVDIIPVGHRLKDVAVAGDRVWVSAGAGLSSAVNLHASPTGQTVVALPPSFCSPMYHAAGASPQYLIVSDLPLQGQGTTPLQMSQAVQYILRQHRFRAGRFSVGLQSCDDGTLGSFEVFLKKCAANARAYARNERVIGVIGPFNSPCAESEIPVLNRAPHGPLAIVSPTNTYVGLTRGGPGTGRDEPARYYPTSVRNYVRLIAADDLQGAADAVLARQLGARRVYALYEPTDYGVGIAAAFRRAAVRLGLEVVGSRAWNGRVEDTRALAGVVGQSGAEAVFVGAYLGQPNSGTLIRDLRRVLGSEAHIITPDGYSDFVKLVSVAGSAAEGVTVSIPGLPSSELPDAGKKFVAAFGKTVGETPSPSSVYAAEAAEVLVDAIARSDGTRASVTKELLATRVSNGLLGTFSFDANGDPTASAVTIYRIEHRKAKVFRVITPPRSLVR
jgi:DNA-binding SARP family transcriptional activator/ABC-type branched-subunit amino acid transport system substrate-binding protein/streptogramin lyase